MSKVVYYPKNGTQVQVNGKVYPVKGTEFDAPVEELEIFVKLGILTTDKNLVKSVKAEPEKKEKKEKPAEAPKKSKAHKAKEEKKAEVVKSEEPVEAEKVEEEPVEEVKESGIAKIKNIFKK